MGQRFLDRSRASWDRFAQSDPLWAVLSDPAKHGGRWEEGEFFATGRAEIDALVGRLRQRGWLPDGAIRALDFGCGVGRLSRALADHAAEVVGVDVSPEMVSVARRYCDGLSCTFVQNDAPTLPFPPAHFGLIYSNLVLQHIAPPLVTGYVREFLRVLDPDGICVFQLPSRRLHLLPHIGRPRDMTQLLPLRVRLALRRLADPTTTTVTIACAASVARVTGWVHSSGGIVEAHESRADRGAGFISTMYYARRR
jgi:SAM-dependent methyltransferase